MNNSLLTISKAASIVGVHPDTLRGWGKLGHIPCVWTLGGHRRYRIEDVLRCKDSFSRVDRMPNIEAERKGQFPD